VSCFSDLPDYYHVYPVILSNIFYGELLRFFLNSHNNTAGLSHTSTEKQDQANHDHNAQEKNNGHRDQKRHNDP
jgi:hypothetical protein